MIVHPHRNRRLLRGFAGFAALALVAAACGGDDDGSDTTTAPASSDAPGTTATPVDGDCSLDAPLKIGFAADLGELGAFSDGPGSEAARVQVDLINEAGGIGGQQVDYVVKDIQGDPAATQRAATELLEQGVHAIIGPPFSNTGAPLADTVGGAIPIVYMATTDSSLADPSRGMFITSFSDAVQSAAAAEFALDRGLSNAVLFSSADDIYFSGNPKYFAEAFTNGGGTIARDFAFSLADEDFATQVNAMASLDPAPDVLFTAMVMPQIAVLLEQMTAAGIELTVIGADAFDATEVWGAGPVAEGVFFTAHTFPGEGNDVQAFLDAAAAKGAEIATVSFGALSADAVQIIAAAVTNACSLEGADIIAAIDALVDLPVTTGSVTYAGAGGIPEKDVTIVTVTDGLPAGETTLRPSFIPAS
jgi:branched-chain amino acid transport system substrate-binding protein